MVEFLFQILRLSNKINLKLIQNNQIDIFTLINYN